jgi:hypothetical protein
MHIAALVAGTVDVALSYCHYCLNDTLLEDYLPYLQDKQVRRMWSWQTYLHVTYPPPSTHTHMCC